VVVEVVSGPFIMEVAFSSQAPCSVTGWFVLLVISAVVIGQW